MRFVATGVTRLCSWGPPAVGLKIEWALGMGGRGEGKLTKGLLYLGETKFMRCQRLGHAKKKIKTKKK